jgi:hypothetical protein
MFDCNYCCQYRRFYQDYKDILTTGMDQDVEVLEVQYVLAVIFARFKHAFAGLIPTLRLVRWRYRVCKLHLLRRYIDGKYEQAG